MNYTYYYFCDNEEDKSIHYEQAVHVHDNEKMYQCTKCSNIEVKNCQDEYSIECQICGNQEKIHGTVSFKNEVICLSCGVKGKVGLDKEEQFILNLTKKMEEPCSRCHKRSLTEMQEEIPCPRCFKPLKIKMSTYWEKRETE